MNERLIRRYVRIVFREKCFDYFINLIGTVYEETWSIQFTWLDFYVVLMFEMLFADNCVICYRFKMGFILFSSLLLIFQ